MIAEVLQYIHRRSYVYCEAILLLNDESCLVLKLSNYITVNLLKRDHLLEATLCAARHF